MLAFRHASNREALRIAGAINPLRKLLSAGPDNPVTLHAVATFAAMATGNQSNKVIPFLLRFSVSFHDAV
jgi:hypothetical protein